MATATGKLLLFVIYVVINGITMTKVIMAAAGKSNSPIFVFGDSTADVGTNNHLKKCTARADHPYNGIDFPFSKATGRFSNGKNAADQIAKLLGNYKVSPPPFLSLLARKSTFKRNLLRGANFASGGSGILSETGQVNFHKVICLAEQIQQFGTVRRSITELLGSPKAADDLIQNSIYIISINGSNDLVESLLSGQPGGPDKFVVKLTETYATHLTSLYDVGARKFAIIGIPPIGCCPAARVYNSTGGCFEELNDIARSFYTSMQSLLIEYSKRFKGFKYSHGNAYAMTMNVIDNPRGNGFEEGKTACCGSGRFNGVGDCEEGANLCSNRGDYLFWDRFHPTESASELAALTLVYGEGSEYVTPMNFSSLAMV